MSGVGKKPPMLAGELAARVFDGVSKAALIDALWCACQLGTDESREQIMAKMARETQHALEARGDRPAPKIRKALKTLAAITIDSD